MIGMGEALRRDPTLREVAALRPGWKATRRDATSAWTRSARNLERDGVMLRDVGYGGSQDRNELTDAPPSWMRVR